MPVPTYAVLIFGLHWGGWAWMSLTPQGRFCYWVAWYREGDLWQQFTRFNNAQDLEMYFDMVDDQWRDDGSIS